MVVGMDVGECRLMWVCAGCGACLVQVFWIRTRFIERLFEPDSATKIFWARVDLLNSFLVRIQSTKSFWTRNRTGSRPGSGPGPHLPEGLYWGYCG